MAIKGLKGLGFPEIGRIKKGELVPIQGKPGKFRPVDLDYFKITFEKGFEQLHEKFYAIYPEKPTSINIRMPFNDIEEMWDPFLEAYTASRMLAKSDGPADKGGMVLYRCDPKTGQPIVRNGINLETGLPEPHPEDNIAGYDYQGKPIEYKPVGRLKVIVPELKEAAYMTLVTSSWNDCENISSQLYGIKELNLGVIKGVPLTLMRSDQQVMAPIEGKKVRVTKSLVSIKADSDWVAARMEEDKQLAFPVQKVVAMLEPSYDHPESETETTPELTDPTDWGKQEVLEGEIEPETPAEAVTEPSEREPYSAEEVKSNIQKGISQYDKLLASKPDGYAVQVKIDSQVIASIVNAYIPSGAGSDKFRYAIFEYLLGKGKGSTKTWTAQEVGTIKNLWLKVGTYGDSLGDTEEEELRRVWNQTQLSQGQQEIFP